MRKSLFLIMLATAAMPALAAAPGDDRGGDRRAARAEQNERSDVKKPQRSQRAERPQRAESPQRAERAQRAESAQRGARAQRTQRAERGVAVVERSQRATRADRGSSSSRYAGRSSDGSRRNISQNTITLPSRYSGGVTGTPSTSSRNRDGDRYRGGDRNRDGDRYRDGDRRRDGDRYRDGDGRRDGRYRDGDRDGRRWSGDWRRDNRYNWRHHRGRHSSIYRLGRYHDPFGYGYRRFSIGLFLGAGYYGNNYWLNDPWQYRLPPAYGPYRWVRYYNDALLVNIYSGEVVDVIYGFFW